MKIEKLTLSLHPSLPIYANLCESMILPFFLVQAFSHLISKPESPMPNPSAQILSSFSQCLSTCDPTVISRLSFWFPRRCVRILRWITRWRRNHLRGEVAPREPPLRATGQMANEQTAGASRRGRVALARMVVSLNHTKP